MEELETSFPVSDKHVFNVINEIKKEEFLFE
jgi:hypothetical protein